MDQIEARLKLLELARPTVSVPDVDRWLASAARLEAYVFGAGTTDKALAETKTVKASTTKVRTTAE
jgi:hypothetical protein